MGILTEYKERENARIERFFDMVDKLSENQVDTLVRHVFEGFYDAGFVGRTTANQLLVKINAALKIKYVPGPGAFDTWHKEFKAVPFSIKKALLVTIANDLCKLNLFNENQITEKFQAFLNDIEGFLAEAPQSNDNNTANTNDNKGS